MADQASASGAETGIPVFVMLPLDILNGQTNEVNYKETDSKRTGKEYKVLSAAERPLRADLDCLKNAGVKGVMVDCWWGIVEAEGPGQYNWKGYDRLFSIICDAGLDLHVVMSFHACGDNVGDIVEIPLPNWVTSIGDQNPDIFYKDGGGIPNHEYLSLAVDNEPVLNGLTPLQVYYNFMFQFRKNMDIYFNKPDKDQIIPRGRITEIEVGLGPAGELRYPSYRGPEWDFPGIGEFQCYDKYMMESWKIEAREKGFPIQCSMGPQTAGSYNSTPGHTEFFKDQTKEDKNKTEGEETEEDKNKTEGEGTVEDEKTEEEEKEEDDKTEGGETEKEKDQIENLMDGRRYKDPYGIAFLLWYSKKLVDHGNRVLQMAKRIFKSKVKIAAKVPGIHWWYGTKSHAAEATAGLFAGDPKNNLSVYKSIADTLKSLKATFIFTCAEMSNDEQKSANASCEPELLVKQVLKVVGERKVPIGCENALPRYDEEAFQRIQKVAADNKIDYFTYLRLDGALMTEPNFNTFKKFVSNMKGIPRGQA